MTVLLQIKKLVLQPLSLILFLSYIQNPAHADAKAPAKRPIILELFTSQGCSSCPAADRLLEQIDEHADDILALSYHVTYWDYLGWKDPYAKPAFTERQRAYAKTLHDSIYTPQIIIDGVSSTTGSDRSNIMRALTFARTSKPVIPVTISKKNNRLEIEVSGVDENAGVTVPMVGTIMAIQYRNIDEDDIASGENKGRKLRTYHNVTEIQNLGIWKREKQNFSIPIKELGGNNFAVLLQSESFGRIVGAATYTQGRK